MLHQSKAGQPPEMIWFRCTSWAAGTDFPEQVLPWGKLMYSYEGLAKINVEEDIYLSTPEFAIWLPPLTSHYSLALTNVNYVIIHVHKKLCDLLSTKVKTLKISEIVRAIIKDFSRRSINYPLDKADKNLATVLVEQLTFSENFDCFLPISEDNVIRTMTKKMLNRPEEIHTLKYWSDKLGLSERTLSRRFFSSTGINFNEWKLRRKVLLSITLLQEGKTVKYVSATLGYNDPSAFIAMFKKRMGISPGQLV